MKRSLSGIFVIRAPQVTTMLTLFVLASCAARQMNSSEPAALSSTENVSAFGTKSSDLGNKILQKLEASELQSRIPLHDLVGSKNGNFKILSTGGKIFDEYKVALANAKEEVLLASYFWIPKMVDANKYGISSAPRDSYAARRIGEGLIAAQSKLPPGKKLNVAILVNEMILDQFTNDVFRDFLGLNDGQISNILQVEDSIAQWEKMGLLRSKFDFKIAAFEQYVDFNLHDKFMVIDSEKLFVSSANVKPESNPEAGSQYEVGLYMEGESARSVEKYFKDKWTFPNVIEYNCKQQNNKSFCLPIDSKHKSILPLMDSKLIPKFEKLSTPIIVVPSDGTNKPKGEHLRSPQNIAWLSAIENAKNSIEIASPNVSAYPFVEKIKEAIARGVKVRMLVAWGHADKEYEVLDKILRSGTSNTKVATDIFQPFLKSLPKFSVFPPHKPILKHSPIKWYVPEGSKNPAFGSGPGVFHGKYLIADDKVVVLGSGNQEYFSYFTSSELNVLVDSKVLSQQLRISEFEPMWARAQDSF